MTLTSHKIGSLISVVDERNTIGLRNFYGININKEFMPTVASTDGLDESKYKIVRKKRFVYSGMQTGRDKCIRISMYDEDEPIIVSPAYTTFEIKETNIVDPYYFFMLFLSKEKDRLGWFCSDGSIRSNLDWNVFCDIELKLPPIEIQKKYVDIYKSMLDNQKCYERGLDDLKLTCDAYIENLRKDYAPREIGKYLKIRDEQNSNMLYNDDDVMGVSQAKTIIPTKANTKGNDISKFTIIYPYDFVYNPRNGVAVGLNMTNNKYIISWNNTAFYISEEYKNTLKPEYLFMWLSRTEWDRKVKYDSWGSSTEVYAFDAMRDTKIPIPPMEIQDSIVNIFKSYDMRKTISLNIKSQILNLCPILIKGSLEEANK